MRVAMAVPTERFTEIAIALLLGAAIGALFVFATRETSETATITRTAQRPAATAEPGVPTCRAAGITAASRRELTCATSSATLTFVNSPHELRLDGLRARVSGVLAWRASTPSGRARNRLRVAAAVEAEAIGEATAFTSQQRAVYLAIGDRIVPADRAHRGKGSFSLTDSLAPGFVRRGEIRFELAGEETTRFLERGGQVAMRPFAAEGGKQAIGITRIPPPDEVGTL